MIFDARKAKIHIHFPLYVGQYETTRITMFLTGHELQKKLQHVVSFNDIFLIRPADGLQTGS
jgi:hypothetical protein